jgi:two-component system response regulator HydG
MAEKGTVLIIDDRPNMLSMLQSALDGRFDVLTSAGGREGLNLFRIAPTDLVVSDIRMPDMGGMEVLQEIKKEWPETEVILMTAYAEVDQAVQALKAGAYDYLTKPIDPEELVLTLEKALERKRLREKTEQLQEEVEGKFGFSSIVGDSRAMREVFALARKAVTTDTTVLLTGESGTGKELFARAVHYGSRRARQRFLAINCAAMPKDLIESELFGHVRGAFSGAVRDKPGLFEQADGGTLLLDEVGELPLEVQAKINRVLQEGEVRRVGDTRDRIVNVRIIACTNRDLHEAMEAGEFREDLYFRLNVFPLHLPPLRERDGDVPLLVKHFLAQFAGPDAGRCEIEPEAMQKLMDYHWPGNARELRNCIERAVVLCEDGKITADLFAFRSGPGEADAVVAGTHVPTDQPYRQAMDRMTIECQKSYLLAVLKLHGGNVTKAAEHAGIERESFHRLMRKCGLRSEDVKREMEESRPDAVQG